MNESDSINPIFPKGDSQLSLGLQDKVAATLGSGNQQKTKQASDNELLLDPLAAIWKS